MKAYASMQSAPALSRRISTPAPVLQTVVNTVCVVVQDCEAAVGVVREQELLRPREEAEHAVLHGHQGDDEALHPHTGTRRLTLWIPASKAAKLTGLYVGQRRTCSFTYRSRRVW